jgi:hypothetical protein
MAHRFFQLVGGTAKTSNQAVESTMTHLIQSSRMQTAYTRLQPPHIDYRRTHWHPATKSMFSIKASSSNKQRELTPVSPECDGISEQSAPLPFHWTARLLPSSAIRQETLIETATTAIQSVTWRCVTPGTTLDSTPQAQCIRSKSSVQLTGYSLRLVHSPYMVATPSHRVSVQMRVPLLTPGSPPNPVQVSSHIH